MKKNLYDENGIPKRIACYMVKRNPIPADYITVVYTHANFAGYPVGTTVYRAMSGKPFHPLGVALFTDTQSPYFKAGGSRITFGELPEDCKELVKSDYKEIWGE